MTEDEIKLLIAECILMNDLICYEDHYKEKAERMFRVLKNYEVLNIKEPEDEPK